MPGDQTGFNSANFFSSRPPTQNPAPEIRVAFAKFRPSLHWKAAWQGAERLLAPGVRTSVEKRVWIGSHGEIRRGLYSLKRLGYNETVFTPLC